MSLITFYLFENETDLLDRLDKISNIIFAVSTFALSVWIFIHTVAKEKKKDEKVQKLDFLKSLLLENNSIHFFNFYDNILDFIITNVNKTFSEEDKAALIELIIDEHRKYRLKFYDLVLPFNTDIYNSIKRGTDDLIDDITTKVFDADIDYFNELHIDILEQSVLRTRTETLKTILKIN